MKAHEETWTAKLEESAGYDCMTDAYVVRNEHGHRVFDFGSGYEHNDKARSALAAQAPAMARLLLRLHEGEAVSAGCVREALRDAGVIPSFEEEADALRAAGVIE